MFHDHISFPCLAVVKFKSFTHDNFTHEFKDLKKLKVLHLQNNLLTSLDPLLFNDCTQLKTLNLGFNQITEIDVNLLKQNINLINLYLNDNQLTNF